MVCRAEIQTRVPFVLCHVIENDLHVRQRISIKACEFADSLTIIYTHTLLVLFIFNDYELGTPWRAARFDYVVSQQLANLISDKFLIRSRIMARLSSDRLTLRLKCSNNPTGLALKGSKTPKCKGHSGPPKLKVHTFVLLQKLAAKDHIPQQPAHDRKCDVFITAIKYFNQRGTGTLRLHTRPLTANSISSELVVRIVTFACLANFILR